MEPNVLGLTTIPDLEHEKAAYAKWFTAWYDTPDKGLHYYLRLFSYIQDSHDGDQSCAQKGLAEVQRRLFRGEALDQADQWFIAMVISRLGNRSVSMNIICGSDRKRGAGKRGYKSWGVALAVSREMQDCNTTLEEAVLRTASRQHLSESMVKKCWIQWKKEVSEVLVLEAYLAGCGTAGPPND